MEQLKKKEFFFGKATRSHSRVTQLIERFERGDREIRQEINPKLNCIFEQSL